jgi:transposase InsO family protein/transposase-like protein
MGRKAKEQRKRGRGGYRHHHTPELKLRIVMEALEGKVPARQLARVFGVHPHSVYVWMKEYRAKGEAGLGLKKPGPAKHGPISDARRDAVVATKEAFPHFGARKIADSLRRFEAMGVSESQVRRILHEQGLLPEKAPEVERGPPPERRFERAEPNQLWQSDIFSFLLRRHQRVYLTAFMDDHSRFIVSHVLAHHQKGSLTVEALERAVADYGVPREVLTDNGRQYTAWRGTTAFEELLRQYGIRHIKSRPQHPMTLGKVERFWKTLWDEFLSRTVFADFADCERRLALFIQAYNFKRPHQGLEGLVPADRFFRAATHVREAIEKGVANNALRMSLQQPTQKPFYLVGRLGDRDVSIAAAGDGLQVQLGDEKPQTIQLPTETHDEIHEEPNRFNVQRQAQSEASSADPEVAQRAAGPQRDGAPAHPAGALGAVRGEGGDGGHRRERNFAGAVLPAGDEGAAGGVAGVGAGQQRRVGHGGSGRDAAPNFGVGGAGGEARPGEAAYGPAAVSHPQGGEEGTDGVGKPRAAAGAETALDDGWAEVFAGLELAVDDDTLGGAEFDPDAGWRDDALKWTRKLAGADAPEGHGDGREGREEGERLREGAGRPGGAAPAVRGGDGGAGGQADGVGGGAPAWLVTQPIPDADAPGPAWLGGGASGQAAGPAGEASAGGGAGGAAAPTAEGERPAEVASGPGGPNAGSGERPDARQGEADRPSGGSQPKPGERR